MPPAPSRARMENLPTSLPTRSVAEGGAWSRWILGWAMGREPRALTINGDLAGHTGTGPNRERFAWMNGPLWEGCYSRGEEEAIDRASGRCPEQCLAPNDFAE